MKKFRLIFLSLFALSILACSGSKEEKKEGETEKAESEENSAALTYRQFYELIFEDYNNRVEWHEDDFNQEAKASIEIIERGDCDKENCGQKVFVKNNSADQTIRVVTKTSFSIPNTVPYIANQYIMKPGEEVALTCTQFCYGEETYDLAHEIVVAEISGD